MFDNVDQFDAEWAPRCFSNRRPHVDEAFVFEFVEDSDFVFEIDFGFAIGLPPAGLLHDQCNTHQYMALEVRISWGYGVMAKVCCITASSFCRRTAP